MSLWFFQVALAGSSFMAGVLVGSFVMGILSDRFGRKKTAMGSILVCGLAQLGGSFARTYWGFSVSQFVAAIGKNSRNRKINCTLLVRALENYILSPSIY